MFDAAVNARRTTVYGRLRGLGQGDAIDAAINDAMYGSGPIDFGGGTTTTTTTTAPWWQTDIVSPLIAAGTTIGQQFARYANPIYNLKPGTYLQQTPYGTVVSTAGVPGSAAAALGTTNLTPILLIGGVLLVVMMAGRH